MTSALAADPGMVTLGGSLVDGDGAPLAAVGLVIAEELPPDGGFAAFQVTTAADGSFSADIYAWGTADAPASVTITAADDLVVDNANCSQTWDVAIDPEQAVSLIGAAPDPLIVTATTTLLGEVCGTTATPPPNNTGGRGSVGLTPPPTDTFGTGVAAAPDGTGPALTIGFMLGLVLAVALLLPRPGARRRS